MINKFKFKNILLIIALLYSPNIFSLSRKIGSVLELKEGEITSLFLDVKDKNGSKVWGNSEDIVKSNVRENFLLKVKSLGFEGFLKSINNIQHYPIEALLWAYGKDNLDEKERINFQTLESIYLISRKGQVLPTTPVNVGIVNLTDKVLELYFKHFENRYKPSVGRIIKNDLKKDLEGKEYDKDFKVILGTFMNEDVRDFLSETYIKNGQNRTQLSRWFGLVLYSSEYILHDTIRKEFYSIFGFSNRDIVYKRKETGIHFGTIALVNSNKEEKQFKFFVKVHRNYPIASTYNEVEIISSGETGTIDTSKVTEVPSYPIRPITKLDIKELFAYKVLEELGLGPKAKFIENKNIPSYLLIVTEDMPRFITFKEFKKNRGQFSELNKGIGDLIQLSNLNLRPKNDGIEEFIVNLTYFDIIVRSMMLCDMNTGNMGFLKPFSEKGLTIKFYKPVVVDFDIVGIETINKKNREFFSKIESENREEKVELFSLQQKQKKQEFKYTYFEIYESFLNANSTTKYDETLKEIFLPDLDVREEESLDSFERRIELFRKRKRAYGLLAAGAINENNVKSIINEVFNNFKDKILTQISDNALQREREEALSDLEDYKKSIEWNMNRLTKLLEINAKSDNWE